MAYFCITLMVIYELNFDGKCSVDGQLRFFCVTLELCTVLVTNCLGCSHNGSLSSVGQSIFDLH